MVTTRSADKQAGTSEKKDRLALRSKTEETRQSDFHSQSESTAPGSSKSRSKILVNVPPSRKRSRASYDGTDDTENTISPQESELSKIPAEQTTDGRTEIPDSQESPLKPMAVLTPQKQLESNLLTHVASLTAPQRIEEGTDGLLQAVNPSKTANTDGFADAIDMVANRKHRRFGSEDLVEEQDDKLSNQDDVLLPAAVVSSDDDEDDAPEISTSKAALSAASRTQRKTRAKNSIVKPGGSEAKSFLHDSADNDVDAPDIQKSEAVTSNATPSLKIDVSQLDNTLDTLASDDSADSAFVTARTTRHVDVFTTPAGSKTHVRSPMFKNAVTKLDDIAEENNSRAETSVTNLSARLAVMNDTRPNSAPGNGIRRSLVLPRRANNTLENYRRQTLQNRATKSTENGRRANFRLTEDWPAKRRKFVVGY